MSSLNGIKKTGISQAIARIEVYLATKPEWWVWGSCLFIWGALLIAEIIALSTGNTQGRLLVCSNLGAHEITTDLGGILKDTNLQRQLSWSFFHSITSWMLMIWAMMFPLLRKSIRHVALSVRHKDREVGILLFLIGYALIWIAAGLLYILLPFLFRLLFNSPPENIHLMVSAGILILVAFNSWRPSREIVMMQCELTVPIRIRGWLFIKDAFFYGVKIGKACLRMCAWMMLALTIGHHTLLLMALFCIVTLIERYFVPHESKVVGYCWLILAAGIFIYSYIY